MKKFIQSVFMMSALASCFLSCEKMTFPENGEMNEGETNSLLQVRTRTIDEGTEVSFPVNVYVFKGEKCVALQTLTDENHPLSIALTEGDYSVYAIGGASAENYILPSQEDATPSMAIALQAGKSHGDLMAAKSNVTLVDGGTNTLTLALERKVMLLQNVTLNNIPSAATAVSVTISPLWQQLEGTTYTGEEGTTTIALTKQSDGHTWNFTGEEYLLPPSGNSLTIAVNITTANGTSTYSYNTSEQLEASGKFNIQGTYTEAIGVTLTGTITGAKWKSEKTISFEFDESGSQTADPNSGENNDDTDDIITGTIPEVGSTYQTCYVLAVTDKGSYSEVLLLSPKQKTILTGSETKEEALTKIETAIPTCGVEGINGWRLMTDTEITIAINTPKTPNIQKDIRYFYIENGVLKSAKISSSILYPGQSLSSTDLLRPVATIKIKNS
ncbi:MAG: hypothetical protein SPL58_03260 [Bacteroidaceae bacterium]|nr:hypothetical protein [Bacteroidaceae bacterium]